MINDYRGYAYYSDEDIFWSVLIFMLLFSFSIIYFGYQFGRDPQGVARFAQFTTPIAIVLTATFSYVPAPMHSIPYVLSGIFMAPALIRVVYSVVRSARPGYTMTTYMTVIAIAFAFIYVLFRIQGYHMESLVTDQASKVLYTIPPNHVLFMIYGLLLIPAWISSLKNIDNIQLAEPDKGSPGVSKKFLLVIIGTFVLLAWLRQMTDYTYYAVEQFDDILYTPLYEIMPFLTFIFLGFIADKNREKHVIFTGFALYLVSILIALLVDAPGSARDFAVIPLLFTNRFINLVVEFLAYSIPVYLFTYSKRPLLAASAGVATYLLCRSGSWTIDRALPSMFENAGAPLFVSGAIGAVVFLLLLNFIFNRHREKTFAEYLHAAYFDNYSRSWSPVLIAERRKQDMLDKGLTKEEADIAQLLIDGQSKRDIARKLHLTSAELSLYEQSLKDKIIPGSDPDPQISNVIKEYKLTKRETEMLKYLRDGVSTTAISDELIIAEETVRTHVMRLVVKLGLKNRAEVPEWLEMRMN